MAKLIYALKLSFHLRWKKSWIIVLPKRHLPYEWFYPNLI